MVADIPITASSFGSIFSLSNNFMCKYVVSMILSVESAYILIYITLVSDAIVIAVARVKIIDFSFDFSSLLNNFCNIKYVSIVINTKIIIFTIIPGHFEYPLFENPIAILKNK